MSDIAIRAENLSKQYRLGQREPYKALRDTLSGAIYVPFRRLSSLFGNSQSAIHNSQSNNTIWALKGVSFEVKRGEVVGIIGRNGAGKSTLLKVLSRITEPSRGYAEIHGRVGSLLEVGTGFHSELTGRENIYLNGAILGMKKAEIDRKFDEIVAFAEVERFLDTPVKHFSSGMHVRLAFAVAAHLEPEILLIDEVLAVGDAAFQKKCLGKMGNVAREGRTVLFVSHNMAAIRSLCTRGFLLGEGQVVFQGATVTCVDRYWADVTQGASNEIDISKLQRPPVADTTLRINRIRLHSRDARPLVRAGDVIELDLTFSVEEPIDEVILGIAIRSPGDENIMECRSNHCYGAISRIEPGEYSVRCRIEQNLLSPGLYFLNVGARCASKYLDYLPSAMSFEIYSDEKLASLWLDEVSSLIRVPSEWTLPEPVLDQHSA